MPYIKSDVTRGISMVMLAVVFFCIADAMAKYLTGFYPVSLIVWGRFAFHLLIVVLVLGPHYRLRLIRTRHLTEQILRGLLLTMGAMFFFSALKYLPLAEASAIAYLSPLFITLFSVVFLKERIEMNRWIAVLCGFAGVLIIIRPGSGVFTWAALLPMANATTFAIYQIITRRLSSDESPYTSIFYAGLVGTVLLSVFVPDVWMPPENGWHAAAFVGIGAVGALGHLILIKAYAYGPASRLAPFSYSQLIWVAVIGFFAFGDFPDFWSLFGIAILIASGVYMAASQRRAERLADPSVVEE
ncbi:MAG: DMT family transporter [Candidatus Accumulibacter sp.]|nr:DMT family transporter [Accumulibacter sp.]